MRILLVNYEYPPIGGGGGVLMRTLVRQLSRSHDVVVLTSRALGLPAESFEDGARIIRASVLNRRDANWASPLSLLTFSPAASAASRPLLARWRPDLVHTFFAIPSGPAGHRIARRARLPHVLTFIGGDVHDPTRGRLSADRFPPFSALLRRLARGARACTTISSDVAARVTAVTGREDVAVIPCAIDPAPVPPRDRAALGWADDDVVVMAVCRLIARKHLDALVRAAAGVPRVRLEIVGDGPERPRLEDLATTLGARVTFAGALPADERDRRLAAADVFALPSHHEGFGLALLEAMRAGLPVVTTAAGGPRDFVVSGHNGYLVEPGDEGALRERLEALASDAALRRRLGEAARETAAQFTPERMAARYVSVYERALGRPRREEASA